MNREEYEKLEIIKTVEGNEIVEKYYNPITCTMVSKADVDCYKYKQALLDIKEYVNDVILDRTYTNVITEIINKALGGKESE